MPQHEDVKTVRKKYGLITDNSDKTRIKTHDISKIIKEPRNYDRERTVLLGALERISKIFQKQLAQGDFVLDNDSRFVEEFCTIIELCILHGWKSKIKEIQLL